MATINVSRSDAADRIHRPSRVGWATPTRNLVPPASSRLYLICRQDAGGTFSLAGKMPAVPKPSSQRDERNIAVGVSPRWVFSQFT